MKGSSVAPWDTGILARSQFIGELYEQMPASAGSKAGDVLQHAERAGLDDEKDRCV